MTYRLGFGEVNGVCGFAQFFCGNLGSLTPCPNPTLDLPPTHLLTKPAHGGDVRECPRGMPNGGNGLLKVLVSFKLGEDPVDLTGLR